MNDRFTLSESEKNRIRRLHHGADQTYFLIREAIVSSLESDYGLAFFSDLLGKVKVKNEDNPEDEVYIPSLSKVQVTSLITGCVNDFMGWDYNSDEESTDLINGLYDFIVVQNDIHEYFNEIGVEITDDQIYFFIGYILVSLVYQEAEEVLDFSELGVGDEEGEEVENEGLTCIEDFINANGLRDWATQMQTTI